METTGLKTKFIMGASTIAQVAGISPPGAQRDVVEIDDLDPTDEIKQKILGLIDAGEATITLNYDPDDTTHQAVEAALWSGARQTCKIKYPSGEGFTFDAYVTGWQPSELGAGEVMQAEATLTVLTKSTYGAIA